MHPTLSHYDIISYWKYEEGQRKVMAVDLQVLGQQPRVLGKQKTRLKALVKKDRLPSSGGR
jgi:hypothetical protein